jgi:hypothetical protein
MEQLIEFAGGPLEWLQPKAFERSFELVSGETLLATLAFRSAFGTLAEAVTADGSWTFKRVGFLNPRITVRQAGGLDDAAIYQPRFWGGGDLAFTAGPALSWRSTNFWATEWAFYDSAERALVTFRQGREKGGLPDLFKSQATVEVSPSGLDSHRLSILTTLGMYLLILHQDDTAAVVAATSATAAT